MTDQPQTGENLPSTSSVADAPEVAPVPPRFRWLKRIGKASVVLIIALVALRWWWGWEAERRLQAQIDRIRATGRPVFVEDYADQAAAIPDEDNAAILWEKAASKIVATAPNGASLTSLLDADDPIAEAPDDVAAIIAANAEVLALVRKAGARTQAAWFGGVSVSTYGLTRLSQQRQLCKLLALTARYYFYLGDHARAVQTIEDTLNQAQALTMHPSIIVNMVAWAVHHMALAVLEDTSHALRISESGTHHAAPAGMAACEKVQSLIARLLDGVRLTRGLEAAFYGECAYYLALQQAPTTTGSFTPSSSSMWDQVAEWLDRPLSALATAKMLSYDLMCAHNLGEASWPAVEDRQFQALMARPLLPELDQAVMVAETSYSVVRQYFQIIARRRMTATALAIRLYEIDHGQRPETLAALVPEYLPAVPVDPFSAEGEAIRYIPQGPHPRLYSVFLNGRDDGGARRREPDGSTDDSNNDLPFFLDGRPDDDDVVTRAGALQQTDDNDDDAEDDHRQADENEPGQREPQ